MIPSSSVFDQSMMQHLLDNDPVVQTYRSFFAYLNWSLVEQWEAQKQRESPRGRHPHPRSALT